MADIQQHRPPPDPPTNGRASNESLSLPSSSAAGASASKRQRRPSVRLGDIGEQPAALSDPFLRRPIFSSSLKNRGGSRNPTHLLESLAEDSPDEKEANLRTLASSIRKRNRDSKSRRGRTIRSSSWTSPIPDGGDDALRPEFDNIRREDSLSPMAETGRDRDRVRVSEEDAPSETNGSGGDWEEEDHHRDAEGGIRPWLNRLGLGRYAPVFEIHEVDDEVLPMLTLEDLKDMGITAVGSRRKMFCAIQKLKSSSNFD
ncbi:putative ankyrin repeat and SAM domain-containing protein 6 [Iris pallida]|uniref:Ankyrin repeat and SAM domain-containing protein 6 n=1 Tax=Iris pallida TaxID=29817 RepID=A0AAX6GFS0_IRIPA|nr:putative ankyrin repeat and SAM domain-containing protein 6 [Iris pallida]KAJ6827560.1 putative ankyrin repeat and SAM domain-containing protein 6 [Iris pallida]